MMERSLPCENAVEIGQQRCSAVESDLLTPPNSYGVSGSDTKRKGRCWYCCCSIRGFILGITVLGVTYLLIKDAVSLATEKMVPVPNTPPQVQAYRELTGSRLATAEEYTIDNDLLLNKKELRWVPETGNNETFSKPSQNFGCVTVTIGGKYKIMSSITFNYKDVKNIYHAIAWARGNNKLVKRKASYRWGTKQNGQQPSTVQFVIDLQSGDDLCVQSDGVNMIYVSSLDNSFLLERL